MKIEFREAREDEVLTLVKLIADDMLGSNREDDSEPLNERYVSAFKKIDSDPNAELIVAVQSGRIVGMMQLNYIQYLGLMGSSRCIIGGVRVHSKHRGQGLGTEFIKWGIERATTMGCTYIQVTSDKQRDKAIRFYEKLGFKATHEGLRLKIQ